MPRPLRLFAACSRPGRPGGAPPAGRPVGRPVAPLPALLLALWALLGLPACGGSGSGGGGGGAVAPCVAGGGPPLSVTGTVLFQRLPLSPAGLGSSPVTRPVRFADVSLIDQGSQACYGSTSTDATGTYLLNANPPAGRSVFVRVSSRTNGDPLRNVTVHNALPPSGNVHTDVDCFFADSGAVSASGAPVLDVLVPWNAGSGTSRPSIGFAVLDVLAGCAERIREATGEVPPLCHAYTQLGNAGATGTSFYDDGARALTILGGANGALDSTDTDYFDDGVIAHEYGHFVEFNMAASRNRGGPHAGEALEPPFAWSEGAATGWGCLLRQDPLYIDTVRTSPFPPQISASAENWTPQTVWGIDSEESVTEVVWDLGDGGTGPASTDGDGAAVDFGTLYGQFLAFDGTQVAPYLGTLLDRLVNPGGVPAATITNLMSSPVNQQISYPLAGADIWPAPLAMPGSVSGACDSLPGSNKNQCRGYSSSAWYRLTLGAPTTVTLTLTISPTGGNGDNLNLYLETLSGGVFASSQQGGAASEQIGPIFLSAGTYVVRVEADCAGGGNQAGFTLAAS